MEKLTRKIANENKDNRRERKQVLELRRTLF